MRIAKTLVTVFAIMLATGTSCTNKGNTEEEAIEAELIKVDFGKEYKRVKFPHINHYMKLQRLEDHEEYPIGYVDKLIVDDSNIYILDKNKTKSIFIFNRNGALLNVIKHTGSGPGEYTILTDFDVAKKTGEIVVMDANSRKLVFYSSKGTFIREVKYNFMAFGFTFDSDNNIILDTGNIPSPDTSCHLRRIDQHGKPLSNFFPSDSSTIGITLSSRASLQRCDDKLFFLPPISNCIYALDGDESTLAYQIDFGKDWPSKEFYERNKRTHPLKIRQLFFDNSYVCFLNYIQTKDVLHIDFYRDKNYSFYYNKKTKQSLLISMEDESFSFPLATYGDEFVFVKYSETTGAPNIVFYTVNFNLL